MQADTVPYNQEFSGEWNLSFFQTVPSNRLPFDLGISFHIISSLFSPFCLFQNAILHKMLKPGFWNFRPIFLRIQFSLVATFFLETSYLVLWKPNGLSKHLKGHQVIGLDLSASAKLAVKWIILKCYYVVDLILDSIWNYWKIYIFTFTRFIARKLGRLLTLGRIFSTQTLKPSPTIVLLFTLTKFIIKSFLVWKILFIFLYQGLITIFYKNNFVEMWPLKHGFENYLFSKYTENLTCCSSFCNVAGCKIPTWMRMRPVREV